MELVDEEEQEVVLALSLLLESSILGLSESVGNQWEVMNTRICKVLGFVRSYL